MAPVERPSPLWKPGEPLTFVSRDGSEHTLQPQDTKWIGGGNFGEIFRVRGELHTVLQDDVRIEEVNRVIKQFYRHGNAANAVKYHDALQRCGLPVFPEYDPAKQTMSTELREKIERIMKSTPADSLAAPTELSKAEINQMLREELILMLNGNTNRTLTVSQNESLAHSALERSPLWQIENADQLIADIIQTVRKATLFGVFVPFDAYFFFVQRTGYNGTVRHSLDDTDNVRLQREAMVSSSELLKQNICAADQSLSHFYLHATKGMTMSNLIGQTRSSLFRAWGAIEEELSKAEEC